MKQTMPSVRREYHVNEFQMNHLVNAGMIDLLNCIAQLLINNFALFG